jgi:16S rRNA (uracil1498-N3)-methyltransferase
MRLHRFYLPDTDLTHELWMDDERLFRQWSKVLRFEVGREVVLFNNQLEERLYRIERYGTNAVKLVLITEREPSIPERDVYLCFALLKKDKSEWVLQKCTELGVRHLIPLLTERTEKTGFDIERTKKIVIEASEQCGRTDIPRVREPISIGSLIDELKGKVDIYITEQGSSQLPSNNIQKPIAVLIGPEGGWSEAEKQLFKDEQLKHFALSDFTLRAETAAIAAATLLQ